MTGHRALGIHVLYKEQYMYDQCVKDKFCSQLIRSLMCHNCMMSGVSHPVHVHVLDCLCRSMCTLSCIPSMHVHMCACS